MKRWRNCDNCGRVYAQSNRESYCSTECRGAKKSKKVTFTCIACGTDFRVPPSRAKLGEAKYCSTECKYSHFAVGWRRQVTLRCEFCGESYEAAQYRADGSRFCSYACHNKARNAKEHRLCATCGETFPTKRSIEAVYCSWECRVEGLRGENHPSWRGGSLGYHYDGDWIRQRRKARDRDGNICQECGKDANTNGENMSVHHIKPYRSFDDPEMANRLENLVSLCRSCHMKQPE